MIVFAARVCSILERFIRLRVRCAACIRGVGVYESEKRVRRRESETSELINRKFARDMIMDRGDGVLLTETIPLRSR